MATLRVGLIGCGIMGEHYARVVAGSDIAQIAALCDRDPDRLAEFSGKWGVTRVYGDHLAMLAAGGLDAVIVATPDFAHREPVCDCLHAGLPVLCEKPLATTIGDADAIVDAVPESPGLMVNFGNRHRLNVLRLRELIQSGELGPIEHLYIRLNERFCKTKTIAWLDRTSPVWFLLSHCVDLVSWLLNDRFESVYARATYGLVDRLAPGVPDVCSALCATRGGICVDLESSWIMPDAYFGNIDFALQVIGENGTVQADLFPHDLQIHRHAHAMAEDYSMGIVGHDGRPLGWWEESVRSFLLGAVQGELPGPSASDGREVTRTLLALDRSIAEGRTVSVKEIRGE